MTDRPRLHVHLVGIAIAVGFISAHSAAAGMETRCTELGAGCLCSDRLDTSNYESLPDGVSQDPADSSVKECGNNNNGKVISGPSGGCPAGKCFAVQETGMPGGNSVSWVMRNVSTSTNGALIAPKPPQGTTRFCVRSYFRFSSDYQFKDQPSGGTCEANKGMQIGWGGPQLHFNYPAGYGAVKEGWDHNQDGSVSRARGSCQWASGGGSELACGMDNTGSADASMCRGEWCMQEVCATGRDVLNGEDMWAEWSFRVVTGPNAGKERRFGRHFLGNRARDGQSMTKVWAANMYRQGFCAGHEDFSHVMAAAWDPGDGCNPPDLPAGTSEAAAHASWDSGWGAGCELFVGPALEVEGALQPDPEPNPGANLGTPGRPHVLEK